MKKSLIFSFSLMGQIGFTTAIPLVVFGLTGRWLDRHFGTSPYLFLACLLFATIIVFFSLKKTIQTALKEFEK